MTATSEQPLSDDLRRRINAQLLGLQPQWRDDCLLVLIHRNDPRRTQFAIAAAIERAGAEPGWIGTEDDKWNVFRPAQKC